MKRYFIKVKGIVQGVGFRPYIYNLALEFNLKGWVNNNSEGVYIDIEGESENIKSFINNMQIKLPPLAKIDSLEIKEKSLAKYSTFLIANSKNNKKKFTLVLPDVAVCSKCIDEIKTYESNKYKYVFTNCTNCGPRFSIIKDVPYDRKNTTMSNFNMCVDCEKEYFDVKDRRFHAEPNSCMNCGPQIFIVNNEGNRLNLQDIFESENIIKWTVKKLFEGKIFAIKGIGGFHLVCDAYNYEAIKILRYRKNIPHKPFAVMMKNLEVVEKYCEVNQKEKEILTGSKKPIVILNRKLNISLPDNISPFQNTLGVMLPYTPLHELLFEDGLEALIMTSGNVHGLPIEYKNEKAISNLSGIVDYFFINNREIYVSVDDSIIKVIDNEEYILRRARGYVPEAIVENTKASILACGSNMKNTFCISKEKFLILSQYNGNLSTLENYNNYQQNIEHFKNIFKFYPKYVACDIHPDYYTNIYIEDLDIPVIKIQHHHAHIASCMIENNVKNKVIGIAFDGTGFGMDEKIWGGEFLVCDLKEFKRFAHLEYVKMPGGEKAIIEPWRMGVAYIFKAYENGTYKEKEALTIVKQLYGEKALTIWNVIKCNLNCPETSSMGRLFDAVSSIIGIRDFITYEGQASIELENRIYSLENLEIKTNNYTYEVIKRDYIYIISFSKGIKEIIDDRMSNVDISLISLKFHNTIRHITLYICTLIKEKYILTEVALSGGVFQNTYLLKTIVNSLINKYFKVYTQKKVPTNDGGIALGQIVIANEIIKDL